MGKGSKRRPTFVSRDTFDENWEKIFGKGKGRKSVKNIHYTQEHRDRTKYNRKRETCIIYDQGEDE